MRTFFFLLALSLSQATYAANGDFLLCKGALDAFRIELANLQAQFTFKYDSGMGGIRTVVPSTKELVELQQRKVRGVDMQKLLDDLDPAVRSEGDITKALQLLDRQNQIPHPNEALINELVAKIRYRHPIPMGSAVNIILKPAQAERLANLCIARSLSVNEVQALLDPMMQPSTMGKYMDFDSSLLILETALNQLP